MAKAGGIVAGILILLIGGAVGTVGFGGNAYLDSQMIEAEVPGALQQVRDGLAPEVKYMTMAEVLATTVGDLEVEIPTAAGTTPENFVLAVQAGAAMALLGGYLGEGITPSEIMNNNIQVDNETYVKGCSEWALGSPLGFDATMSSTVLLGDTGIPGILEADPTATGVPGMLVVLGMYATPDVYFSDYNTDGETNTTDMAIAYGLPSVDHLDAIAGWINYELLPSCPAGDIHQVILWQWGGDRVFPDGISNVDPELAFLAGWELNASFSASDMAGIETAYGSILNSTELAFWFAEDYDSLDHLGLSTEVEQEIHAYVLWLDVFSASLAMGMGIMPLTVAPADLWVEAVVWQWASAALLPEGVGSLAAEAAGFEANFTDPATAVSKMGNYRDLFVDANTSALTNAEGCAKWFAAEGKEGAEYDALMEEFGLTADEMGGIIDWLVTFRDNTMIDLAISEEMIPASLLGIDTKSAIDYLGGSGQYVVGGSGAAVAVLGLIITILSGKKK